MSTTGPARLPPARRPLPLVAGAALALVAAGWGGLARSGWPIPPLSEGAAAWHGTLMASGFLGTLIALERALVLRRAWANAAPALATLATLAMLADAKTLAAASTLGAAGALVAVLRTSPQAASAPKPASLRDWLGYATGLRAQPAIGAGVMLAGAAAWAAGALRWLLGADVPALVPWWLAFLVLSIAGERLELSRMLRPAGALRASFVAACALVLAGAALTIKLPAAGLAVVGLGFLGLAAYLLRYDIAPRTARRGGLVRFIGIAVTSSYVWLAAGGVLLLTYDGIPAGLRWDATVHAITLGFALVMVMAHAPIVLPAILGVALAYRPAFYAHLILLHASLALRIGGDLAGVDDARRWGGLLSGVAIVLLVANTARAVRGRRPI